MLTRGDKILIVIIVIISITILMLTRRDFKREDTKIAVIKIDGKIEKEIELVDDVIGKKIRLESEYGYNIIEVGDGDIRVIEASCPDKLDVKQGAISETYEIIVCLPNKMTIEIEGDSSGDEVDYIAR